MKLVLHGHCHVDWADRQRNIDHCRTLNRPKIRGPSLAVVGGGPSINRHIETLRNWRGDIWAVNGTYQWCRKHGIAAAFYSADATPDVAELAQGAKRAILADVCDPSVFAACPNAEVFSFTARTPGPTSTTTTLTVGIDAGFTEITYFGSESSYEGRTHAYQDLPVPHLLKVKCGPDEYLTEPEFLVQAEVIAAAIRAAPHVFKEQSGGFLSAMVEHGEYDAIAASLAFHQSIILHKDELKKIAENRIRAA